MKQLIIALVLITGATDLMAQTWGQTPLVDRPRNEDHHWRKRILTRIDLREKENQPFQLVQYQTDTSVYRKSVDGYYRNQKGVVRTLLAAYFNSKGTDDAFPAYDPKLLEKELDMNTVKKTLKERSVETQRIIQEKIAKEEAGESSEEDSSGSSNAAVPDDDPWGYGDMGDSGFDDFEDMGGDLGGDLGGGDTAPSSGAADVPVGPVTDTDLMGTDIYFELIEDRIFDKNKSDMYYDKLYIRIFSVNSGIEGKEDVPLLAFRYEDVRDILSQTQWKNPHNDAEMRNCLEMLDGRMFRGTIINVSGETVENLLLSDKRRTQMVEYEHNLWTY
ncbi:MAG: hypothetical protein KF690_07290 [Bacteroidetes bacterium]|nr:hypothetical protein [Bacteroidota bacterium]